MRPMKTAMMLQFLVDLARKPATVAQDDEQRPEEDISAYCSSDTESTHMVTIPWPPADLAHHSWRQDKERLSFKDDYVSFPSLEIFEVAADDSSSASTTTLVHQ